MGVLGSGIQSSERVSDDPSHEERLTYKPVISIMEGLTDPFPWHQYGANCRECLAKEFDISLEPSKIEFALRVSPKSSSRSPKRAVLKDEIHSRVFSLPSSKSIVADDIGPQETVKTWSLLGKLKPFFDRKYGSPSQWVMPVQLQMEPLLFC